jgi:hypothetical protein
MSLSGGSDIALSGSVSSLLDVFRTFSRYHSDKDPACPVLMNSVSWLVTWMSTSALSSLPDHGDIVCMQDASHGHSELITITFQYSQAILKRTEQHGSVKLSDTMIP